MHAGVAPLQHRLPHAVAPAAHAWQWLPPSQIALLLAHCAAVPQLVRQLAPLHVSAPQDVVVGIEQVPSLAQVAAFVWT